MSRDKDSTAIELGNLSLKGVGQSAPMLAMAATNIVVTSLVILLQPFQEWMIFVTVVVALLLSTGMAGAWMWKTFRA